MSKNLIWCDFNPGDNWAFHNGLNKSSDKVWEKIISVNNDKTKNKSRYIKYFIFSFRQFIHRNKFTNIIAWQQFYGLIFAFFCRLFNVKKTFNLFVMIFIYIPKKGLVGRIYKAFIKFIVTSKYIDKIFVFSSSEAVRYEKELDANRDKFVFMPFGDDIESTDETCDYEQGFIFSSGYSNRDFDFLTKTLYDAPFKTRIFGWEDYVKGNVTVSSENVGSKLDSILKKAKLVVVPLKENRESGQFTIIHAFEAGIPVIATDTDCMKDYIENGVNGFILPNSKNEWLEKINMLYNDDQLYYNMSNNCKRIYKNNHTQNALGRNVGEVIKNMLEP